MGRVNGPSGPFSVPLVSVRGRGDEPRRDQPGRAAAGDSCALQPGDQVVADGRLAESTGLTLDESILTGEDRPGRARARGGGPLRFVRGRGRWVIRGDGGGRAELRGEGHRRGALVQASPLAARAGAESPAPGARRGDASSRCAARLRTLGASHAPPHGGSDRGRGDRDDGSRGPDPAHKPYLRRRRNPARATRRARPAAERDRVDGLGGPRVPRQDRHADGTSAARARARAGPRRRSGDLRRGASPVRCQLACGERDARGAARRLRRTSRGAGRGRALLVAAPLERAPAGGRGVRAGRARAVRARSSGLDCRGAGPQRTPRRRVRNDR